MAEHPKSPGETKQELYSEDRKIIIIIIVTAY